MTTGFVMVSGSAGLITLAAGDTEGLQELAFGEGDSGFSRIKSSDGRKVAAAMVSSHYFFTWIETEGSGGCRGCQ